MMFAVALVVWIVVGVILITGVNEAGRPYIAEPGVLGTFFGVLVTVILPIIVTASKSVGEKVILRRKREVVYGEDEEDKTRKSCYCQDPQAPENVEVPR